MSKKQRRDEGLSAEELKRKMYQSLQSAGVLNNLKGYLRQSVINELRGKHKSSETLHESDLLAATIKRKEDVTWNQKAIDNLILYHLKQSRYQYSLSLFQQEAGITEYNESLTDELLHRLGASPDLLRKCGDEHDKENDESLSFSTPRTTSTPIANSNNSKLLLWRILSRISSAENLATKIDPDAVIRETREQARPMSLADKLQAIDEEMDGTLRERRLDDIEHRKSVATLASATRRAEEAAEKRARDSLEQWKKVELVSMRVKEAEKARETVTTKTKQLEDDYSQRKEALLQREQSAIDRLNNQKEALEKDLHQQRQLLLQELEQIRMRERNLQDREHMMSDIEAVKMKELDLLKSEALSSPRHLPERSHPTLEKSRRDSVVSSCAESLRKSLTGKEGRQLDEVLKELDGRSHEAEMLRRELESMKEEMAHTKRHLEQISHQKHQAPTPHPEVSPREQRDHSLRRRLDDLTRQLNDWRQKDRDDREATIQSEVGRWRNEVTKLSEARDQLDEKQRRLEEMTLRLHTKLNSAPDKPPTREPSAASLRILMDPQSDPASRSIRDYDPVYTGRVRWADKMPYSVHPGLTGKDQSPRRPSRNLSANSNIDLNSSNESSSSSQDVSTSGLRLNIQQKFRDLEKESETLEQMYKRYIQTNYKHMASDIPRSRSPALSPRNSPRSSRFQRLQQPTVSTTFRPGNEGDVDALAAHATERPTSSAPRTELRSSVPVLPEYKPTSPRSHDQSGSRRQGTSIKETTKPTGYQEEPAPKDESNAGGTTATGGSNVTRDTKTQQIRDNVDVRRKQEPSHASVELGARTLLDTRSPLKLDDLGLTAFQAEKMDQRPMTVSGGSESSRKLDASDPRPTPTKRLGALPPLSATMPLPQITPRKERRKAPVSETVSELLLGSPTETQKMMGQPPQLTPEGTALAELPEHKSAVKEESSVTESISSHSESHPLNISTLRQEGVAQGGASPEVKSPFERPALLGLKRDELQKSLDQSEESPRHDVKLHPSFHDDDGLQNLLDSIDMNSARSLEGDADPKLADLLNQLEPNTVVTSQKPDDGSSDEFKTDVNVAKQQGKLDSEQSASDAEEKLLSDRSADYSDKFLSSTASKTTSSEIKTMSDFEPSSTSIPRIDDKVAGSQHSDDEEKSGADVHWSHLQLDRSGELVPSDAAKEAPEDPRKETMEKGVDVFGEDQSVHSFEAASDIDKKSHSSGDDFW